MESHRPRPRILLVDDEPQVTRGLAAILNRRFDVCTAQSGEDGLVALSHHGPFPVVISDMAMPGMDGAAFLSRARDLTPDTVRLLLTGQFTLEAAVAAVNGGGVYRILLKPCPPELLNDALTDAVDQYRMVTQDRELMNARLDSLMEQVLYAERVATLGTIAGAVGHELNNASAVLKGTLELVRLQAQDGEPPGSEEVRDLLRVQEHIETHATELLRLGRPAPKREAAVDFGRLVSETLSMLKTAGVTKGIDVVLELPSAPASVEMDRMRVEQALINLVKNAVHAVAQAGDGARRISVRVRTLEASDALECEIEDTGCGIPSKNLARVFEPYFSTKPEGVGTGLGLAVVKQIVETAGGRLTIDSVPGAGTRVCFTVPKDGAGVAQDRVPAEARG